MERRKRIKSTSEGNNLKMLKTQEVWIEGHIVWARLNTNNWWPGLVIKHQSVGLPKPKKNYTYIFWFGDHRVSQVVDKNICRFDECFELCYKNASKTNKSSKKWLQGIFEAIQEFGFPLTQSYSNEQLLHWALNGFKGNKIQGYHSENGIPKFVQDILLKIKEENDDEEATARPKPTPHVQGLIDCALITNSPGRFCLSCYSQIGLEEHPLFYGFICTDCKKRIKNTIHSYGEDGISYYCAVCGYPGNVTVCSSELCGKVYCESCVKQLSVPGGQKRILETEPWECFFCMKQKFSTLIKRRHDWKQHINSLFISQLPPLISAPKISKRKQKIRVLSLFDGIGTGLLVLDKLNLDVDVYYSSEIDDDALNVTEMHFANRITNIGDVRQLTESKLKSLLPVDLLIAGSPCNDLSIANPKRKGIYDLSGTGVLFFEFYRILSILRRINQKSFFWLFENVSSMQASDKDVINRFLQCEPKLFDAAFISAQRRPRLFWGNLPTLWSEMPTNDHILQDCLLPHRRATVTKVNTVTTRANSLRQGSNMLHPVKDANNKKDTVWITELEQIFGFPRHYTDTGNISASKRQQLLGRAWSVHVIQYLFRCLLDYYKTKSSDSLCYD